MAAGLLEILLVGAGVLLVVAIGAALHQRGARLRAEAQAAFWSAAIDRSSDGLISWTTDPAQARLSPALARRLETLADSGFSALLARLAEDDRARLSAALDRLARDGTAIDGRFRQEDGTTWRIAAQQGPAGTSAWLRDVTAAERTDEERAAMQTRLDAREAMLDCVPVAIWHRPAGDLAIDYRNRTARALFGDDDRIGRAQAGTILAGRALRLGSEQTESANVVVEGRRRLIEIAEVPLADGTVIGHARDVSQLAETQDELARHVAAHGELLQKLTTALAIYGRDKRLKLFNDAFVALWQLDRRWLASEPDLGSVLELLRQRRRLPEYADFAQAKRQMLQHFTGLIDPVEDLLHLPDGRTLRQTVSPHPQGGLLMTYEDVSDRVAIERSYNTLIAVQRETLDSLGEAVAAFTGDGRLQLFNPAFVRLWNLEAPFLGERPHLNEVARRVRGLLSADAGTSGLELVDSTEAPATGRIDLSDGRVLDFGRVALPDGATLLIYQDVSDTIRVERALRDRNDALETADRLKSEFIANVSYELRTPLNAIVGFAQILAEQYFGPLNERQLGHAESIIAASGRLVALINDILDLSSIEAGYMTLAPGDVDVRGMLEQLVILTREPALSQNLSVTIDCAEDIGSVRADERRLRQALMNLISNALKFTPRDGTIRLSARREEGALVLVVADSGIGIDDARQGTVFDPFVRAASAQAQAGPGLGLALVRRLIELHGGSVAMASTPGSGTAVTVRLPA